MTRIIRIAVLVVAVGCLSQPALALAQFGGRAGDIACDQLNDL